MGFVNGKGSGWAAGFLSWAAQDCLQDRKEGGFRKHFGHFSADSLLNPLGSPREVVVTAVVRDRFAGSALSGTSTCSPMRKLSATRRTTGRRWGGAPGEVLGWDYRAD